MTTYAMLIEAEVLDHVTIKQVRARFPDLPEADDLDALAAAFADAERDLFDELGVFPVADPIDPEPEVGENQSYEPSAPIEREDGTWGRDWIVHRYLDVFVPGRLYARINGEQKTYPYTLAQFRSDWPNVTTRPGGFKQMDDEWGIVEVEAVEAPEAGPNEVAEPDGIEKVGGVWKQKWTLRDRSSDELATAKMAKRAEVNQLREAAITAPLTTPKGTVQADRMSAQNIQAAVTMAQIAAAQGQPFSVTWIMADNSLVEHDASDVITMGVALGTRAAQCYAYSADLKAAIDAAEDFAALAEIDIEGNWP